MVNREPKELQAYWRHGQEMKRWGTVYSFPIICCPFILQGPDQWCVSRSGVHILAWSLPGVPQTGSLCLGKLERELIVFKVPRQESDAQSHRVLSHNRQLGAQLWCMPIISRFCSGSPRCKTGHERCFYRSVTKCHTMTIRALVSPGGDVSLLNLAQSCRNS